MTRDEARDLIAIRLGFRTDLNSAIVSEMKLMQTELEGQPFLPWFLVSEFAQILTLTGEERVTVPPGFIREIDEGGMWMYDAAASKPWTLLPKEDYELLVEEFQDTQAKPRGYALVGEYFRLKPTPDGAYQLKIIAYVGASVLDTDIENAWLKYASDLMIARVASRMAYGYIQNPRIGQEQQMAGDQALARLRIMHEAREHANRDYVMGGDN